VKEIMLLLLRAIPEAIGIIGVGTVLARRKPPLKNILLAGILGGVATWAFRQLPLVFGSHAILAIMVFIVVQRQILRISLERAIAAALLGFALLGVFEYLSLLALTGLLDMSYDTLLGDEWLSFLAGLPSLLGLWLVWLGGRFLVKGRGQGGDSPRWH
jgi:hypothetical protein